MSQDANRIPTIRLWGLLLVPLQGDIDDRQGELLCTDVLSAIERFNTQGLIIDVTGLWLMDSHLCSVLSTLASAAALMGTRTVLCSLSPEIAITLQTMGLEMPDVATVPSLEDALTMLGIGPHYAERADAADFDEGEPNDDAYQDAEDEEFWSSQGDH
ncbi:MAG: STAS domain-containing protein [Myxococcales bacterium]